MSITKRLLSDKTAVICILIILVIILAGAFASYIAPNDPLATDMSQRYASPSMEYPLGNDHLGRCVLSRILFGIKSSVFYVLFVMAVTLFIGMVIGMTAGFAGGRLDEFLMRFCDLMQSFPSEVVGLAFVGIFGISLRNLLIACILTRWVWFAKLIRASVRQYRERNYVYYAKAIGSSNTRIILKHMMPSVMADIMIYVSNNIGGLIMVLAGFSFLGLGVPAPTPEWGMMLNEAKDVMLARPWLMLPPGLAIMLIVCAFSFLGDSLRDIMDPKHSTHAVKTCRKRTVYESIDSSKS